MAHIPINHPLQPLYRVLAGLIGVYLIVFGIAGVIKTRDLPAFAQHGLPWVLGLRANLGFAILSIVVGLIVLSAAFIGGKASEWTNMIAAIVFLVAGITMMALMQTDLNLLGFTMTTCIVSFVIGLVLFTAALYGKTGTADDIRKEEAFRHGRGLDSNMSHPLTAPKPAHGQETTA
jgi:Domain of unknown function (DUF4383)